MRITSTALSIALMIAGGFTTAAQAQRTETAQGVDAVEVMKATATVEQVDLEHRKVTLLLENGKKKTFKVDKSVQNLDQIKVGDHLKMSYTEEILIMVGKTGETPSAAAATEVGIAPRGGKPGVVMVETSSLSAKILGVNAQKHQVTLEDPDGKKRTIKVSSKVNNLNQLKAGDSVDVLITESLVVDIVK
jgi:Cu/Ag efflux protein CusF